MATVHANSAREALRQALESCPSWAGENVDDGIRDPDPGLVHRPVCHVERSREGSRFVAEVLAVPGRVEGNRIETATLFTFDGRRCERGTGSLDLHDRFAAAGFDLSSLLEWGPL